MFDRIEIRQEQYNSYTFEISAHKDGVGVGILESYTPSKPGENYYLANIEVSEKERGLGAELLRRFAQIIGPGQTFEGSIIHEGTVNWLARNGFFNGVHPNSERTFTNPSTLRRFPFTRFLEKAGVELVSLTTSYNERDYLSADLDFPHRTAFVARTLKLT